MTIPTTIVTGGKPFKYKGNLIYEKTTSDDEVVAGRILMKGTADHQAKIFATGGNIIGVGDKQPGNEGKNASGNYDDNYAHDGKPISVLQGGDYTFNACLKDGETITKGDLLEAEDGTGKLVAVAAGTAIAQAMESASPSGADKDDFEARWVY